MPLPAPNPFPKVRADDAGVAMKIFTDALLARLTLVDAPVNALPSGTPTGTVATVNAALSTLLGRFNKTITEVVLPIVDAAGPLPNRVAWDMSLGNVGVVSVTKSCTILPPTNAVNGTHYTLILIQNSTGNFEVTLDSVFKDVPSQNIGPNEVTVLELYYHAPNFYAPNDIKKIEERLDVNDTSITELTAAKDDHEGRVSVLETAGKDKKVMIMSNRKPNSYMVSMTVAQSWHADNAQPDGGWLQDVGYPIRFADLQVNMIPDASVTHVVTMKESTALLFAHKFAIHRDVTSPMFTYASGHHVLASNPTEIEGIDIIVRAVHTSSSIPSASSTVDTVTIAEGDLIFVPNHSDATKKGIYRRDSAASGGYALVPYPGGLVATTILVTDGTLPYGGMAYKVTGGYGVAFTFTKKDGSTTTSFGSTAFWNNTIGRGAGGSPTKAGWEGGSKGFPVFGGVAIATTTTAEEECGYTVINLPAGTYQIGGNLHQGDFATSISIAKFISDSIGFVSLVNSQGIPVGAPLDSVLGFNDSFSLTEQSSIAVFIKAAATSTVSFDNNYAALSAFNKNRRGTIFIEKISDAIVSVDNDEEVVPAGFMPGFLTAFYENRLLNPAGAALPDYLSIHMDYLTGPQVVKKHNIAGSVGNALAGGSGRDSGTRMLGYIYIDNDGSYNIYQDSYEAGCLSIGLKPATGFSTSGHANQWRFEAPTDAEQATYIKPLTWFQNSIGDEDGPITYLDQAASGNGSPRTWFNNNTLGFQDAVNAASPGTAGANRRIRLKAGLYPFFLDVGENYGDSNSGHTATLKWVHPIRGNEIIPASYLLHKQSQYDALVARVTPTPGVQSLPGGYVAGTYVAPAIAPIPPHSYI